MRITGENGAKFDFEERGGKLGLFKVVDSRERLVAFLDPPQMQIVLDDSESPSWEKIPLNWGQFVSRLVSRMRVQLPPNAKPPWA